MNLPNGGNTDSELSLEDLKRDIVKLKDIVIPRKLVDAIVLTEDLNVKRIYMENQLLYPMIKKLYDRHEVSPSTDAQNWDTFWMCQHAYTLMSTSKYRDLLPGRYLNYKLLMQALDKEIKFSDRSIAEIGCGSGVGLNIAGSMGARQIIGLDHSAAALAFFSFLAFMEEKVDTDDYQKFKPMLGDYRRTTLPDDSVDIAYDAGVVEHLQLDERVAVVSEMTRIVKPQGYVMIAVPNTDSPFYRSIREREMAFKDDAVARANLHPAWDTVEEVNLPRLMESCGLEVVKYSACHIAPSSESDLISLNFEDLMFYNKAPKLRPSTEQPLDSISSILTFWSMFENRPETTENERMKYGWYKYCIGQKNGN